MPKKSGKRAKNKNQQQTKDGATWLYIDPERIRFQHARIRPYFSGCGRSVTDTLEEIRQGRLQPSDLPPIQVLEGPSQCNNKEDEERWYFSLNNRRLWVLKQCRKEGLLQPDNNVVRVRVRLPKSKAEMERYTLDKCALEAKFMRESSSNNKNRNKNDKKNGAEEGKGELHDESEDDTLSAKDLANMALAEDDGPTKRLDPAQDVVDNQSCSSNRDDSSNTTRSDEEDDSDDSDDFESSRQYTNAFSALCM